VGQCDSVNRLRSVKRGDTGDLIWDERFALRKRKEEKEEKEVPLFSEEGRSVSVVTTVADEGEKGGNFWRHVGCALIAGGERKRRAIIDYDCSLRDVPKRKWKGSEKMVRG